MSQDHGTQQELFGQRNRCHADPCRKFSDEQEIEIAKEYLAGSPRRQLAKKYGVSTMAIDGALRRTKTPRRGIKESAVLRSSNEQNRPCRIKWDEQTKIVESRLAGATIKSLAEQYSCATTTISRIVEKRIGRVPQAEIPPFPPDIDRDQFGHYVAGFTDGEGHFGLRISDRKSRRCREYQAVFCIGLRADDSQILRTIRSYFQCGGLYENRPRARDARTHCDQSPAVDYIVTKISDLHSIIVPHFEKYRLRAKKWSDFELWKDAVALMNEISVRKVETRGYMQGTLPIWREHERERFEAIRNKLAENRKFRLAK